MIIRLYCNLDIANTLVQWYFYTLVHMYFDTVVFRY